MTDVIIYKPAKTAMQSGTANAQKWLLEFVPTAPKFLDDLMGWVGQTDTTQQMRLWFETEEEALAYASSKGYRIKPVPKPKMRVIKPKSYADNFKFSRIK